MGALRRVTGSIQREDPDEKHELGKQGQMCGSQMVSGSLGQDCGMTLSVAGGDRAVGGLDVYTRTGATF